ncbi:SufS family cysteine desulfurase [Egibacter rhizosphaerae]|uniref:cysteine desulfurase n=1 Tax=Egibacter rhizosphaerae TaxID=1670831 RepID=A0A411YJD9_9ACTN|nr:SufS family cysteine desulfurase [Egibacter rhizosphaerae]QBI21408.1 SufS family cysteine desulfurase [Egibacter rhizosphaerae]
MTGAAHDGSRPAAAPTVTPATGLDARTVRKDFPGLDREVHGKPLVYLDSAATSQTPRPVIDAMARYYEHFNSNVHRGVHALAEESTEAFEGARHAVARFVGADPRGVVFTKNATEAFNLVAYSWARKRLGPGDVLLSTQMEHHANLVPWQLAAQDAGFELAYVPVTDEGELDRERFDEIVASGRVKLFAVTAMSNVVGTINPVAELAGAVRAANDEAVVVVDGAQSVPHLPTDQSALDADFLCFSGHKMLGPTGVGVLAARPEVLDPMPPFLSGGEMITNVTLEGAEFNEIPYRFEAGTPVIAEAIGLGAAVEYLERIGMSAVRAHEVALLQRALPALEEVEGVTVHGPRDPERRGAAVSFSVAGLHPHDIGTLVDREGVAVRAGHHCAKPLVRSLGSAATTRASFYLYNTEDEIDALIAALEATKRFFDV